MDFSVGRTTGRRQSGRLFRPKPALTARDAAIPPNRRPMLVSLESIAAIARLATSKARGDVALAARFRARGRG